MRYNKKIFDNIKNKSHYLSNNPFLPKLKGNIDFIDYFAEKHYNFVLNRFKKVFNLEKITKTDFINVKNEINVLSQTIKTIEQENQKEIIFLLEEILENSFEFKNFIEINLAYIDNKGFEEPNENKKGDQIQTVGFYDYETIKNFNQNLSRKQITHSLICGASHSFCNNLFLYERELYEIHPDLYMYYFKYKTYVDFIIWVFDDSVFNNQYNFVSKFLIGEDNDPLKLTVKEENLYQLLFQSAKGIYSLLLNENEKEGLVQYDNVWNLRVGILIWNQINSMIKDKKMSKYILDDIANMSHQDFELVFNNLLIQTDYGKEMINDACQYYQKIF